ncbi:MAG: hypothetical protein QF830_13105 [Rhodospirillales bacterium]|jgi:hypothetical protein|nr:hypothetical protein [Rhodospirillales bacterium]MDP6885067.1 hypothetical protein [Rhodospirillales bacterium]
MTSVPLFAKWDVDCLHVLMEMFGSIILLLEQVPDRRIADGWR